MSFSVTTKITEHVITLPLREQTPQEKIAPLIAKIQASPLCKEQDRKKLATWLDEFQTSGRMPHLYLGGLLIDIIYPGGLLEFADEVAAVLQSILPCGWSVESCCVKYLELIEELNKKMARIYAMQVRVRELEYEVQESNKALDRVIAQAQSMDG